MAQKRVRVLMSFPTETDHEVEELTGNVITHMDGNKAFPTPPVELTTLRTTLADFTIAVAAAAQGGVHATNEKNKRRHGLNGLLRKLALYVQANCNDDLATLTSSGFPAASAARAQTPLPKPVIAGVDNGHATQLVVKVQKIPTAKAYIVEIAAVTAGTIGEWKNGGVFTKSRGMTVNGLTPGTTYAVRVRAVGGSTGSSDSSDPVSHMCM